MSAPSFLPSWRGLPSAFAWLWVGTLVNRLGGFVVPFLALYLTAERGMSVERAGIVLSLYGVGAAAAGPVGGMLADSIGRRATLGSACALGAAAMLALGIARTSSAIGAAALFVGLLGESYRPAVSAIVADVVPEPDRPRAYGLLYWAVNLGFTLAPIIAGVLIGRSFFWIFVADAATTLVFGGLVVSALPETRPRIEMAPARQRMSLTAPYRDALFVAFIASSLLVAMIFYQGQVALPIHLREHGIAPRAYGLLLSINGALIVVAQPFVTSLVARSPRGRALAIGALLTGIGFGLNAIGGGFWAVYAASIAVWTCGEIALSPVGPAVVADLAPSALRGSYQGAYQLSFGGAAFLAPSLGSVVLERLGAAALWGCCIIAGALAAIAFAAIGRSARVDATARTTRLRRPSNPRHTAKR